MKQPVFWTMTLTLRDGALEDLKPLKAEMCARVSKNEPGCIAYEWGLSADGAHLHLIEGYCDEEAAMNHIAAFQQNFVARFFALLRPVSLILMPGAPRQVRDALAVLNPEVTQAL